MRNILIVMGRYLPGCKDGGPIRSIVNLVDCLGDEYNFKIVTLDRDSGDCKRYEGISVNNWNKVGKAEVYYTERFSKKKMLELIKGTDLIYVCGCFDDYARYILSLKKCRKIAVPVVIASMGLFSPGAFNIKKRKKQLYMTALKCLGLLKNIYWSATSQMEVVDIKEHVSKNAVCYIAQDLPRQIGDIKYIPKEKKDGELRVTFLSRISPKKNLLYAINCLKNIKGNIHFSIYGPKEDMSYWKICEEALSELPCNVSYEYKGSVESEKVIELLQKEQIFLFPTLGENYGHVILEAMMAACPVVISNETPWHDLEENGVGYVTDLKNTDRYRYIIQKYTDMENEEFNDICSNVFTYACKKCTDKNLSDGYRNIFNIGR